MKNLIICVFILFAFASCQKKSCYTCVTITDFGGATEPKIQQSQHCEWTETDKINYVQKGTMNSGSYSSRVTCSIK